MIEYLERIGAGYCHDLWLVRTDGVLGHAQVFHGSDHAWEMKIALATLPWITFSHPRVVPVLSLSWTDNRLVIIHGDERGPSILKAARMLTDPRERIPWAIDELASVAEAIAMMAEHEAGFIHRRANHEQIIIGSDGHARLRAPVAFVKWGTLGSYTGRSNQFTASIRFMAPEQVRSSEATPATDVHALAGTLYAAITSRPPFSGKTEMDTVLAITNGEARERPSDTPAAIVDVIERGLAVDPAQRPVDPAAFAAELRAHAPPVPAHVLAKVMMAPWAAHRAPHESELIVGNRCPKKWNELSPTRADGIRHCDECRHDVVQVRSLEALVPLLGGRCVAFTPDEGN